MPHSGVRPRFEAVVLEDGTILTEPFGPKRWPVPHPYPPFNDPLRYAAPTAIYAHQTVGMPPAPAPTPSPVSASPGSIMQLIFRHSGAMSPSSDDVPSLGSASSPDSSPYAASAVLVDSLSSSPTEARTPGLVDGAMASPNSAEAYSPSDYGGGLNWLGSPTTPTDGAGYYIQPGMFSPNVPFTPVSYENYYAPPISTTPLSARQKGRSPAHPGRSSAASGRKVKAYKTKPCKFYRKDGHCPQGALCTFIHDSSSIRNPKSPDTPTSASSASSESSLPLRPRSEIEEKHARGLYPITWRVIGGGVPLGGQRQVCANYLKGTCEQGDDCPLAHPEGDDLTRAVESAEANTFSPIATPRASTFSHEQLRVPPGSAEKAPIAKTGRQLSIKIPSRPEVVPDVSPIVLRGREADQADSLHKVKDNVIARPHSTPPGEYGREAASPYVKTYAAESPAI
ncbi:hypothetical protein BV25DRAFT_345723 [Artomyces pyxidatus]|uniref:Uncharacterized protein n=1 Tax=Artomyces pyxidatus TaxID=48021 RepID=A0ACB8T6U1_9AGAM|nr:hypothetical protein BV25DRAFT_345723 [Artomyces pyxidatus]